MFSVQGLLFREEWRLLCVFSVLLLLAGCGEAPEGYSEAGIPGKLSIYTVNYPLKYFAERIGGDLVNVQFPAPADEDPAYWVPSPEVITAYQQADLILLNGAGYAKWLDKVSLPPSKLVDTAKSFPDRLIKIEEQSTHIHGPEGKHAHGALAFTIWLDLSLAVEQARAVKDAIAAKLPGRDAMFERRFLALKKELLEIDKQLSDMLSINPRPPVVFSHPVYQYFQRRYGVNGKSVHWEPEERPTEAMWAELKKMLRAHPATQMVWEGGPDTDTVAKLKSLGVESVIFDACGTMRAEGDLLSVMRKNVKILRGTD